MKTILDTYQSSYSIPCTILKPDSYQHFQQMDYVIDKDVLAQMLYEGRTTGICPIVFTFHDHLINGMARKGAYLFDDRKEQFIYAFGEAEHPFLWHTCLMKNRALSRNAVLVSFFTSDDQLYDDAGPHLTRFIELHGNLCVTVQHNIALSIQLDTQHGTLQTFYWITPYQQEGANQHDIYGTRVMPARDPHTR